MTALPTTTATRKPAFPLFHCVEWQGRLTTIDALASVVERAIARHETAAPIFNKPRGWKKAISPRCRVTARGGRSGCNRCAGCGQRIPQGSFLVLKLSGVVRSLCTDCAHGAAGNVHRASCPIGWGA